MAATKKSLEPAASALSGTERLAAVQSGADVYVTPAQIATLANASTRPIANGGTGATTAATARDALGLEIGADVQAWSANLDTHSGQTRDTDGTLTANSDTRYPTQKAVKTAIAAAIVSASGDVVGAASSTDGLPAIFDGATGKLLKNLTAAQIRDNLGVEIGADVQPFDADLAAIAGLTATTDNFMQSKSSAWASRTVAQVAADLQGDGLTVTSVGYRIIPQNIQNGGYTCVAADDGKHIFHASADTTPRTWTIPANASVAYPIGAAITFVNQNGAGDITIAIASDTMRLAGAGTTGSRTLADNGIATALKVTSTEWIISGTGLT